MSKSNLDERPFVQVWTISILKAPFAFRKFNNILVIFDHGLFCSKSNNKKVHFCLTYIQEDSKFSSSITVVNRIY